MQRSPTTGAKRGVTLDVDGMAVHALRPAKDHRCVSTPIVLLHGCGSLAEEIEQPFSSLRLPTIAFDRPGYGSSDQLPAGNRGPSGQSVWLERVLETLDTGRTILVAHSLAAGAALLLAQRRPDLVSGLLLLAPFCRPTPHRAMPMLRLAAAPLIGPLVCRHIIRPFADPLGRRCLRICFRPNAVPRDLSIPFRHAVTPRVIRTMADELRAFNKDMHRFCGLSGKVRTAVLHGAEDMTADPDWHLEWLLARVCHADIHRVARTGHMPHHVHAGQAQSLLHRLARDVACERLPDLATC